MSRQLVDRKRKIVIAFHTPTSLYESLQTLADQYDVPVDSIMFTNNYGNDDDSTFYATWKSYETDAEFTARLEQEFKSIKRQEEERKLAQAIELVDRTGLYKVFPVPAQPAKRQRGCGRSGHPYDCGTMNEASGCYDSNADQ